MFHTKMTIHLLSTYCFPRIVLKLCFLVIKKQDGVSYDVQ